MKSTLELQDKFHVVAAQGWLELGDHRERKQRSNVRMAWSSGLTTRMSHDEERINGDRTRNEGDRALRHWNLNNCSNCPLLSFESHACFLHRTPGDCNGLVEIVPDRPKAQRGGGLLIVTTRSCSLHPLPIVAWLVTPRLHSVPR